mmetsp:Transcript_76576/g.199047  ORF Transcript_76576/g.199047 Transcript_76576/m.199047 type:complete len:112 (+) Transcript_76576:2-337(+)
MQRNNMALEFASPDIKEDPAFHEEALKTNSNPLRTHYIKGFWHEACRSNRLREDTKRHATATGWCALGAQQRSCSTPSLQQMDASKRESSLPAAGGAIVRTPQLKRRPRQL